MTDVVYIVMECSNEHSAIMGVYNNADAANEKAEQLEKENWRYSYGVEEHDISG